VSERAVGVVALTLLVVAAVAVVVLLLVGSRLDGDRTEGAEPQHALELDR